MDKNQDKNNQPTTSTSSSTSSPCSQKFGSHGDESSDENLSVPETLIGAENYLTLTEGKPSALTKDELTEAVTKCQQLILNSSVCSDERKWLVRRLIELRYQLLTADERNVEAAAVENETDPSRVVQGHHFNVRYQPTSTVKRYCDSCCGAVWNVVQAWYQCDDCRYKCHTKCVDQVRRPCAQLVAAEQRHYERRICPEVGLAEQDYQCAECKLTLSFKNVWYLPRLCDYTGLYYCTSCHWNNTAVIPARVFRNWDFKPYPVCRATYQLLKVTRNRLFIKLDPVLYGFVKELAAIKRLREEFSKMKPYLVRCREAKTEKKLLWKHFGTRPHLLQPSEFFSLRDLIELHNQTLLNLVEELASKFTDHITKTCMICSGQGYVCELCNVKDMKDGKVKVDIIFPFSSTVAICSKCAWVYHKSCWLKHNKCTRCERRKKKEQDANETPDPI